MKVGFPTKLLTKIVGGQKVGSMHVERSNPGKDQHLLFPDPLKSIDMDLSETSAAAY